MEFIEIASLVASFVSIGLGILAIWLSVVFYKMSSQISESTREAAKGIGSSVDRLEKLFDKLYSDTFTMMKDTVSDMRKHIWPEIGKSEKSIIEETDEIADEKLAKLKQDISTEMSNLLQRLSITDTKVDSIMGEMRGIVNKAIDQSRKVETEAREQSIREHILRIFSKTPRIYWEAADIVDKLDSIFSPRAIIRELETMGEEGIITWGEGILTPRSKIKLFK